MNRLHLIQSALLSTDEEVRLNGLQSLYHFEGEERIDLVCVALGDESWRIRKEAVNLFLSLPQPLAAAERIIALLYDEENAGVRNAAAEILTRVGSSALPVLMRAADSPDPDVRKFIIDILGDIGDRQATPLLLNFLQHDTETNVRAAAAENLGKIRDVSVVPDMVGALSSPDLLVQFSLLDALARIGSSVPVAGLVALSDNKLLKKPLFDALGRIGDETAVPLLVAGLQDSMRNVREAAILALQSLLTRCGEKVLSGYLSPAAQDGIAALLSSPALQVQRAAIAILGRHGDRERTLLLAPFLDDDRLSDEVAAIFISRGHDVVADLAECWREASEKKKAYLAYLFGATGVESVADLLVTELNGADDFLQTVLLRVLGQIGRITEVATLAGYLDVPEDEVRQAAVDGLIKLAERYHAPVLDLVRKSFTHADPFVRQAALQVLGRLGAAESEGELLMAMKDESSLVRRSAVHYLDGHCPQHYPVLTLALTDEDGEVRRQAIESLAKSADPSLLAPLLLVLKDEDAWVRATAVRALGRFGGAEALTAIRSGLRDPIGLVTIAAIETLAAENIPFALDEIVVRLDHHDDDVILVLLNYLSSSSDQNWLAEWGGKLLSHRSILIRQRMAELLGERVVSEGKDLLAQRFLVEEDEMVRAALRQSLICYDAGGEPF